MAMYHAGPISAQLRMYKAPLPQAHSINTDTIVASRSAAAGLIRVSRKPRWIPRIAGGTNSNRHSLDRDASLNIDRQRMQGSRHRAPVTQDSLALVTLARSRCQLHQ